MVRGFTKPHGGLPSVAADGEVRLGDPRVGRSRAIQVEDISSVDQGSYGR